MASREDLATLKGELGVPFARVQQTFTAVRSDSAALKTAVVAQGADIAVIKALLEKPQGWRGRTESACAAGLSPSEDVHRSTCSPNLSPRRRRRWRRWCSKPSPSRPGATNKTRPLGGGLGLSRSGAGFSRSGTQVYNSLMDATMQNRWMTLQEVAEYLQLSKDMIYRLAQGGRTPASKVGSRWRFRQERIDRWMEDMAVDTQAPSRSEDVRE